MERKSKTLPLKSLAVSNNANTFHNNLNAFLDCRNGNISTKRLLFNLSRNDRGGIRNFLWRHKWLSRPLRTKDNLEIVLAMISIETYSATISKIYSDIWLCVTFTAIQDHVSFLLPIEFQTSNSRREFCLFLQTHTVIDFTYK